MSIAGLPPPRPDQGFAPAGSPMAPGSPNVVRARQVIIVGTGGELLVYSPTEALGNLIASIAGAAGSDQFTDQFVQAIASYGAGFATALAAGFIQFFTGSLAAGWSAAGSIASDGLGDIAILAKSGRQVITNGTTLDDGAGNATFVNVTVSTINGSSTTGSGNNGGVTSGPSGTVSSFPAAGPNHTHAEFHQHPI